MEVIQIGGRSTTVSMSGRGYVTIQVGDAKIFHACMEQETKEKLVGDILGWQKEMARLREIVIKQARTWVRLNRCKD
jgi:hypothetical protein